MDGRINQIDRLQLLKVAIKDIPPYHPITLSIESRNNMEIRRTRMDMGKVDREDAVRLHH